MAFSTGVLVLLTCCCLLTRAVQEDSNPSNDIEVDKKAISKTNSLWTDCSKSLMSVIDRKCFLSIINKQQN